MQLRNAAIVCVMLLALSALAWRELSLQPDGRLHLYFLAVGQGDATLIVTPSGKQILVDGGPNTDVLRHLGTYMPFFDRTIELLILTHPDADHLTALPDILDRYAIDHVMLAGIDDANGRYRGIVHAISAFGISVVQPDPSDDIDLGDGVILDVLWPLPEMFGMEPAQSNDTSVTFRILYGPHAILMPGDIEQEAERAILATGQNLRAQILKAPHHGSKTSSSTGFLLAVRPDIAIISAGKDNAYGHPHGAILDRYKRLGIGTRSTAEDGTIYLVFDATLSLLDDRSEFRDPVIASAGEADVVE